MALVITNNTPFSRSSFPAVANTSVPMQKFASGGMSASLSAPWFERREAGPAPYHPGGFYGGVTGGRTDNIPNNVPTGAYVVPADVVSGLGEGNSLAGAAVMDKMFHTLPHGIEGAKIHSGGRGMPAAPHKNEFAKGGKASEHTPIITASGEYLVHPDALINKFGDLNRAHLIMDDFVKHIRKKTAKTMLKLPGPMK